MEKILKGKSSIMYVYRNKSTGDFVDEDGNPTDSVYDSVGYSDREVAIEHLKWTRRMVYSNESYYRNYYRRTSTDNRIHIIYKERWYIETSWYRFLFYEDG